MAVTTTIVISIGYIIAMSSVIDISGGWTHLILQNYAHINVPWQILTLIFVGLAFFLMVQGVSLSTRTAGIFFALEMVVLVLVSVIALITHAGQITLAPFNPANISGGFAGLGLGFPIAVYLFISLLAAAISPLTRCDTLSATSEPSGLSQTGNRTESDCAHNSLCDSLPPGRSW